jgi:hypothetical protein
MGIPLYPFPFVALETNISLGRSQEHEALVKHASDHEALSTQRLEDFFNNEDFKSSSPLTWGRTNTSSATQKMQVKLRDFDSAFNSNK